MRCNQDGCSEQAVFRYTWPGRDESFACIAHAKMIDRIADAMGMYIQLIPISDPNFVEICEKQMDYQKQGVL